MSADDGNVPIALIAILAINLIIVGCGWLANHNKRTVAIWALILGVCLNVLTMAGLMKAASVAPLVFLTIDQPLEAAVGPARPGYSEAVQIEVAAIKSEMKKVPYVFTPLLLYYEAVLSITIWRFARRDQSSKLA